MMWNRLALWVVSFVLLGDHCRQIMVAMAAGADVPSALLRQSRRMLNLSSLLGSATHSKTPYDRIAGYPVFQVTTPWGSPYMNMEKLSDIQEQVTSSELSKGSGPQSLSEEQNEYRTVSLYYMDPDDAIAAHDEMMQMENMEKTDIRITSSSLAKSIRQSSNLGRGLVTGQPVNALNGALPSNSEGGALRYKIVPSKRQLFYAARCVGKERVGLFGSAAGGEDAQAAVMGNSALESLNLRRRRDQRERKTPASKTILEQKNRHMEGYTGIPVFYAPQMQRQIPLLKRLVTGVPRETPLFFNYEDLMDAWQTMGRRRQRKSNMPETPAVEVFNLWDVLTSMERESWLEKNRNTPKATAISNRAVSAIRNRLVSSKEDNSRHLSSITFVPSSRSIQYKEQISARGNGKARLSPMR